MRILSQLILLMALSSAVAVQYGRIVGYSPTSDVRDQLNLDLDQYNIEEVLMQNKIQTAKLIYDQGGHSSSFATLNMTTPPGVYAFESGSSVWAPNQHGMEVKGELINDAVWDDTNTSNYLIDVMYDNDQSYEACQVGALYMMSQAALTNCFKASGNISLAKPGQSRAQAITFQYHYDVRIDNKNARSIRQMTVKAGSIMRNPALELFTDFQLFADFYGQTDYADHWIMQAAAKQATKFQSGKGNANFPVLGGRAGQGEAMMKGTAFLVVYMYTIGRLEQALVNCEIGCLTENCRKESTGTLDEAVAYYAGSLSEDYTSNSTGVFFYALAENRGHNFRTSGHDLGTRSDGASYVNIHVVNGFRQLQSLIQAGTVDSCKQAFDAKNEIIRLMRIPLIQSVLGYAYIRDRDELRDEDEIEKTEAKGASYVASILPYIDHCDPKGADFLYKQMSIGSPKDSVDFKKIKKTLEGTYKCLSISCAEVGGIWNGNEYLPDASPCGGESKKEKAAKGSGITFAVLIGLVLSAFFYVRYRRRKYAPKELMCQGNIHAVSEIA